MQKGLQFGRTFNGDSFRSGKVTKWTEESRGKSGFHSEKHEEDAIGPWRSEGCVFAFSFIFLLGGVRTKGGRGKTSSSG